MKAVYKKMSEKKKTEFKIWKQREFWRFALCCGLTKLTSEDEEGDEGEEKQEEDWPVAMRVFVPSEVWPWLQLPLSEEGEELRDLLQEGGERGGGRLIS